MTAAHGTRPAVRGYRRGKSEPDGAGTVFTWPVRVYYEDTDLGGVMYHAGYLRFLERARTEWLRALGFEQDALRQRLGVLFVVAQLAVDYHRPARFNDCLEVTATVAETGRASLVFAQTVRAAGASRTLICSARVRVACVDAETFKPKPLPQEIAVELDK